MLNVNRSGVFGANRNTNGGLLSLGFVRLWHNAVNSAVLLDRVLSPLFWPLGRYDRAVFHL